MTIRSLIRSPIRAIVGSTLDGIGPSETVDVELYDDDGAFLLDDDGAYLTDS